MAENNLDLLLGEPTAATFGGTTYKLPSDAPIPLVLKTQRLGELIEAGDADQSAKALETLYDEILTLVKVHQPEVESLPLTTPQLVAFFPVVYGGADLSQLETAEAGPTRPKPKTGRAKSRPRRTTSRSSSK